MTARIFLQLIALALLSLASGVAFGVILSKTMASDAPIFLLIAACAIISALILILVKPK